MGIATKIEWADHTWNPWRGCEPISAGCDHCYARRQAARLPAVLGEWGPGTRRVVASEAYWELPRKWDAAARQAGVRRRVFLGSMMDVFEPRPDLEPHRERAFNVMHECRHLDWLVLTKRPRVMYDWIGGTSGASWTDWHLLYPHVWLGTSVEDQASAGDRLPWLVRCQSARLFVSCEPLLGPLDLTPWLRLLDWVIVGGESGPGARPCELAWIRSLAAHCASAGTLTFIKQLGANPCGLLDRPRDAEQRVILRDPKGGDPDEWPEDTRIREVWW